MADALCVSTDYLLSISDEMEVKTSISDKSDIELKDIIETATQNLISKRVMFDGEPATQEAINGMLQAMRMGMLLALDEQKKNR